MLALEECGWWVNVNAEEFGEARLSQMDAKWASVFSQWLGK